MLFEAEALFDRPLVRLPPLDEVAGHIRQRQMIVTRRVPDGRIDAIDDAGQNAAARAQQAIETHAIFRCRDLIGVTRTDRSDRIGILKPALQEADAAIIFNAADRKGLNRQSERSKDAGRKMALEGDIMHGQNDLRRRSGREIEIGCRQRRLPVMHMDDIRHEDLDPSRSHIGSGTRQGGEPHPVVGPVLAVRPQIAIAGAIEEMRRLDRQEIETMRLSCQNAHFAAKEIVVMMDGLRLLERRRDRRIDGQHHPHLDAVMLERRRQGAHHIGKPTGLHQRKHLRCDSQYFRHFWAASLSIIGWVMRQTPVSVRRNRFASSSGSSPTTRPSGISTPRSMTTRRSLAPRPILT